MRVIKLGGSLAQSEQLAACLEHITAIALTSTIIVPGGGEFANQVRAAQQHWRFDDIAAHHMAILAMQQMAIMFQALQPGWALSSSLSALKQTQKVSIWFPDPALLNRHSIPASWDITSDSLAAWLADRLAATELIVVKAAPCPSFTTIDSFVEQGILDAAFVEYARNKSYTVKVISSHDFLH